VQVSTTVLRYVTVLLASTTHRSKYETLPEPVDVLLSSAANRVGKSGPRSDGRLPPGKFQWTRSDQYHDIDCLAPHRPWESIHWTVSFRLASNQKLLSYARRLKDGSLPYDSMNVYR
jgi:hypothetical protein